MYVRGRAGISSITFSACLEELTTVFDYLLLNFLKYINNTNLVERRMYSMYAIEYDFLSNARLISLRIPVAQEVNTKLNAWLRNQKHESRFRNSREFYSHFITSWYMQLSTYRTPWIYFQSRFLTVLNLTNQFQLLGGPVPVRQLPDLWRRHSHRQIQGVQVPWHHLRAVQGNSHRLPR